jgi:phospholipase/lecithinase/hemolysin
VRRSGIARIARVATGACLWLAAALCVLVSGGATAQSFAVPNPHAAGLGDTDIAIRRLVVFGDSYTKLKRKSWRNWAEQLRHELTNPATGKTLVTALPGYAVSGATAGSYAGETNNLARQVTRWLGTSPKFINRDLTVVYVGYNDIKRSLDKDGTDLDDAKADFQTQLNRIIAAGAPGGSRRIFLIMPHDWGRSPRYVGSLQAGIMRARTQVWNDFLAGLAHDSSYTRLVALDLFTAMECVFRQPADFGFDNVTHKRPQGADPAKYLFDLNDDIHFGRRGQELIRQVVQHYLTRGWDWSNTYKDPTIARQKLVADLRAGKVFGISCDPYPAVLAGVG